MGTDLEQRVRVLSDGPILDDAIAFAREVVEFAPREKDLRASQLHGLQQYARGDWGELKDFVRHQVSRKWEGRDGETHPTKRFYDTLGKQLNLLGQQARLEQWELLPAGLPKKQFQDQVPAVAIRLAREFVQHLVAEILFRRSAIGGSDAAEFV
jgi:hypothetical protein